MRLPIKLPNIYVILASIIVLLCGGYFSGFLGDKRIECETTTDSLVCFKENKLRSLIKPLCTQVDLKINITHNDTCSKVILDSMVKENTCKIVSNCTFD